MSNLADVLRTSTERAPGRQAIIAGSRRYTYGELYETSSRFAGALRRLGVRRGEHVALILPNVPEFTTCYFGCHAAGAVVVPLNPLLKTDEIAYHLEDSDAVALVALDTVLDEVIPALERVPSCRHLIVVSSQGADEAAVPTGALGHGAAIADAPMVEESPGAAEDTAVILYTSGTTGRSKGAELTHDNLLRNAEHVATRISPIDETSVCLGCLPLFHSFGQTVAQNAHLARGGRVVLMPRFNPDLALGLMQEHQVSCFAGVPTMYFGLLNSPAAETFDPSELRYALSGGAPMPVEVLLAFNRRFATTILEGYGLSETAPVASFNVMDRPQKPGSVGRPIDGVEFRLVTSDGEIITTPRVPGEIWIKGHNVMKRYYGKPEATAQALETAGFARVTSPPSTKTATISSSTASRT